MSGLILSAKLLSAHVVSAQKLSAPNVSAMDSAITVTGPVRRGWEPVPNSFMDRLLVAETISEPCLSGF